MNWFKFRWKIISFSISCIFWSVTCLTVHSIRNKCYLSFSVVPNCSPILFIISPQTFLLCDELIHRSFDANLNPDLTSCKEGIRRRNVECTYFTKFLWSEDLFRLKTKLSIKGLSSWVKCWRWWPLLSFSEWVFVTHLSFACF